MRARRVTVSAGVGMWRGATSRLPRIDDHGLCGVLQNEHTNGEQFMSTRNVLYEEMKVAILHAWLLV
jgi:hypothetical protein